MRRRGNRCSFCRGGDESERVREEERQFEFIVLA